MNITVNSQILAAELRMLGKVVPRKPAIQILSHVLLTATDSLSFYATDLEVALSSSCDAQVIEPGVLALPAEKLAQLVEQFPDDDVSIVLDKAHVLIKCGLFKSRLQVLPWKDFPQAQDVEGEASTLDSEGLGQLVARTRYAVIAAGAKYILQGALLTLEGSVAAMVATDSKRLALATMNRTGPSLRAVIPAKALDLLVTLPGADVEVTVGPRHLFFRAGRCVLTSRTIDGEFPKYERIIPRNNDKQVTIDRVALIAALRRVTLVAEDNQAVTFSVEGGMVGLTSSSAHVGSAAEVVPVEYAGETISVCLNGGYVLDFLNAAVSPTIVMHVKDAKGAVLLTDADDHLAVILPMRGQ